MSEQDTQARNDLISELVLLTVKDRMYTAYGIWSLVNRIFDELDMEYAKLKRPQTMYNYARNGLIVAGVKETRRYTKEETITFLEKYIVSRIDRLTGTVPDEIEVSEEGVEETE